MSLLNKIFGKQNNHDKSSGDKSHDNTTLLKLLHDYRNDESSENYQRVVDELMNGNAFLLLPTVNRDGPKESWRRMDEDEDLKPTSVFNVDGLTVLGAFTGEEDRKSTRLNSSHVPTSYAVFCLTKQGANRRLRSGDGAA